MVYLRAFGSTHQHTSYTKCTTGLSFTKHKIKCTQLRHCAPLSYKDLARTLPRCNVRCCSSTTSTTCMIRRRHSYTHTTLIYLSRRPGVKGKRAADGNYNSETPHQCRYAPALNFSSAREST